MSTRSATRVPRLFALLPRALGALTLALAASSCGGLPQDVDRPISHALDVAREPTALSALVLWGVRLPAPTAAETAQGRPLRVLATQPLFITAVICGAVSYLLMNFLMTAAPLAMHLCGHPQEVSTWGLQWHVIAMYAPSFFTGRLIGRFGAQRMVIAGLGLIGLAVVAGLSGLEVMNFWLLLILLGVGWNFGFLGASALVLECHRPEERTRVQSLNDFLVFGTMALGSFASGSLLVAYDWSTVLQVSFLPLGIALALLLSTLARPSRG